MKHLATVVCVVILFLIFTGNGIYAQGHVDPAYLQIQSAENPITIDGKLNETDWQRRFDHLIFRSNFKPGDVEYAVTGEVEVQAPYEDTTTTIVKVLHDGLDLYISLQSDDHSVCRFDGSWEGDGLFMKIHDASGTPVEYKLYFNLAGTDPDIHFEQPGLYPTSGEAKAWKPASTIVNDTTASDSGYTAELLIHLDDLGYTDPYADVPVLFNIFDPDGYTGEDGQNWAVGSFHKMWWGSEWGPDTRILRLADKPAVNAINTDEDLVLDGQLNEAFWADADCIEVGKGSHSSSGGYYMQWGDTLNTYSDQSNAVIKFVHKGTELYMGVQSNDSSVCKWSPGWEADGLFLWMTYKGLIPQPAERLEIKAMYFDATEGSSISFETNANVPTGAAEGASCEPAGTVTHTETNGADAGYSIEVVVHLDMFGYSDEDTVKLSTCIWDLDYASADAYDATVADYAPNWWGTQWVDANFEKYYMYRDVILEPAEEEPAILGHTDPAYLQIQSAENPITIDGKLDETDWQRRFDHLVFRSNFKPGDVQYAVSGEVEVQAPYEDTTTTIVKVLHDGLDLYISLQSNDHSVCKFDGSWEGDGLFMKIADANGALVEYKLYFNQAGQDPDINFELPGLYPASGEAAAWKHSATIVNDTTAPDSGYTAEMVIHLDQLGYTDPYVDIPVLFNIFDCDGYTGTEGWEGGAYHKMWWGSEWGPDTRLLRLSDQPLIVANETDQNLTLDGQLNESFWADANSIVIGKGSYSSSGGYYMQWGNPDNTYTDTSAAVVKFVHKGANLYIGIQSNDASVCKWSPGWEADGLFLWMTYKGLIPQPAERLEIKAMYFDATEGSSIIFETNANVPTGAAEGASYEPSATVTHTETNGADAGYSIEVLVHTDMFGYSDGDTVKLSACIWDLDYASADAYDANVSDYAPNWWGTQWADANFEKYYMYRDVVLLNETNVRDENSVTIANEYRLEQNYPNPFNPSTSIEYNLPKAAKIKIEVFNILGSRVVTLADKKQSAGVHSIKWDGKDESGVFVGSGVYFYKISTPEFNKTKKMLLMK